MNGHMVLDFFSRLRPECRRDRAAGVARRLDLDCGRQVARMSTGMRQKLALAVVLATESPLVILDEPTANLDPESKHRAQQIIQRMMQKKTVICITHDPEMMTIFPRVYQLTEGVLVEKK
jgi:ABC-2 type transport system ATP-binding protein